MRQWLNRPDDPEFDDRAATIKGLLAGASAPLTDADRNSPASASAPAPDLALMHRMQRTRDHRALVSFDEKPGMQAKERIAEDLPVAPGRIAKQEFEYVRHGTMVLLALMIGSSPTIAGYRCLARIGLPRDGNDAGGWNERSAGGWFLTSRPRIADRFWLRSQRTRLPGDRQGRAHLVERAPARSARTSPRAEAHGNKGKVEHHSKPEAGYPS